MIDWYVFKKGLEMPTPAANQPKKKKVDGFALFAIHKVDDVVRLKICVVFCAVKPKPFHSISSKKVNAVKVY